MKMPRRAPLASATPPILRGFQCGSRSFRPLWQKGFNEGFIQVASTRKSQNVSEGSRSAHLAIGQKDHLIADPLCLIKEV